MKKSQVFLSCLGTTVGTVLIGVQPVLGLTWVLTADLTSPAAVSPCCTGIFDFDGVAYTNVNLSVPLLGETFTTITIEAAPLNTVSSISTSGDSEVFVTFAAFLDPNSPAGTMITFTGTGTTTALGPPLPLAFNGTVTAQPVPVPYEFESVTGLAILGMGYGLHKLRKRRQQQRTFQTQTPDQQLTSDNSQLSEISEDIESESLAENHRELVKSIKKS